jgi:hypothetical protein
VIGTPWSPVAKMGKIEGKLDDFLYATPYPAFSVFQSNHGAKPYSISLGFCESCSNSRESIGIVYNKYGD